MIICCHICKAFKQNTMYQKWHFGYVDKCIKYLPYTQMLIEINGHTRIHQQCQFARVIKSCQLSFTRTPLDMYTITQRTVSAWYNKRVEDISYIYKPCWPVDNSIEHCYICQCHSGQVYTPLCVTKANINVIASPVV